MINGNFENINDSLFMQLNKKLTPFLNEMLNSYYFEGDFKATSDYDNNEDCSVINYHEDNTFSPFLDLGYLKYDDKKPVDYNLQVDPEKLITALKTIDPIYALIYEDSAVKRTLNLINKKELDFTTIYVTNDNIYEVFAQLHSISHYDKSWNQHQKYQIERTLQSDLKNLNKLSFINFDNNINRTFIIAHNKHQIAGVSCIANYSSFDSYDIENVQDQYFARKYMAYSSYIAVSSQFRGAGLGVELMKKTFEHAKKNKLVMIRSSSTEDGHDYLKKNIDNLVLNSKDTAIVNSCDEGSFNEFCKIITNIKNDKEYDEFYEKLKPAMAKISEVSINYDRITESDDGDYDKRLQLRLEGLAIVGDISKKFQDSFKPSTPTRKIKNHV